MCSLLHGSGEVASPYSIVVQVPEWCEEEWRSLMEACWVVNPAARPSMRDICRQLELVLQMALAHGL